jgi:single-strand DNA-binding protein|tara:strand:+ start:240 stop:683 length:444 start_codon:yes stop_codon:yes gene_type:complete
MMRVFGDGNICQELDLRVVPSGRSVINLRLSVFSRKAKEGPNERFFIDLTLWGELAENAAESFQRGDSVIFSGVIQEDSFTGRDGSERKSLKIVGDSVGPALRYATARPVKVGTSDNRSEDANREQAAKDKEIVEDAFGAVEEEMPF